MSVVPYRSLPEREPRPAAAPVRAVIALGSNLGDRRQRLDEALEALAVLPLTTLIAVSEAADTVALTTGGLSDDEPRYLNAVALVDTALAPTILLGYLHEIEHRGGRERAERWGNRTIDLDLIAYGTEQFGTDENTELVVPHPRAHERDFVLAPWLSIDPDAILPGHGPVSTLLQRLRGDA